MDMGPTQVGMSPSHAPLGLPPYSIHDGSMSSSQSISSSNSGREVESHEETADTSEGGAAGRERGVGERGGSGVGEGEGEGEGVRNRGSKCMEQRQVNNYRIREKYRWLYLNVTYIHVVS